MLKEEIALVDNMIKAAVAKAEVAINMSLSDRIDALRKELTPKEAPKKEAKKNELQS
jgi:hypothetical protein